MCRKILLGCFIMMIAVIETSAVVRYVNENPSGRAVGSFWANDYQPAPSAGSILYVKQNAGGGGSSWADAYSELADALLEAKTNANIKEIWVAAGAYKPLHAADGTSTEPRDRAFVLVEGLKIYGGFPADANDTDHTSISTRGLAPLQNATILSGDLEGDDTDDPASKSDNAYHVVIGADIPVGETTLDGFIITGGNADSSSTIFVNGQAVYRSTGGGIINSYSFPTLKNLTVSGNTAYYDGGGIYNENSSPTLTNLTISGNTADWYGGGICNIESSPTLTNVIISGNTATSYSSSGGGIYNSSSSPTITNVTISGNTAAWGGGIYNYGSSSILTNVTISGNT
ncbi:MAG: right-handed parallel beta-helix repeat-containing protein, partial [Candidatus Symbiothrix sp.]|nr:right-handed parallel beta-helix repeat-containing protein [Candidatus Symbiothrix sp.]